MVMVIVKNLIERLKIIGYKIFILDNVYLLVFMILNKV